MTTNDFVLIGTLSVIFIVVVLIFVLGRRSQLTAKQRRAQELENEASGDALRSAEELHVKDVYAAAGTFFNLTGFRISETVFTSENPNKYVSVLEGVRDALDQLAQHAFAEEREAAGREFNDLDSLRDFEVAEMVDQRTAFADAAQAARLIGFDVSDNLEDYREPITIVA